MLRILDVLAMFESTREDTRPLPHLLVVERVADWADIKDSKGS